MSEKNQNLVTALAYYQAINNKDALAAEKCLHSDVRIISPLATVQGKELVLDALKGLIKLCSKVVIRAQFSADNQVMLAADMHFSDPIGILRAALLLQFEDGLIYKIEMFYDGSQAKAIKGEIFK